MTCDTSNATPTPLEDMGRAASASSTRRNIALELATLAAKVDLHRDPATASEATWDRLRNRLSVPAASGPRQALLFCGMPVVVDEAVPEGEVWIGSKRFVMPEGE